MTTEAPLRVLIVEDDRAMRQSLLDLLEAAGWRVEALSRADRAEATLATFNADVILSDVRMPGQSGLDFLRSLDPASAPPVVLISAHGDIPMAVEAMQAGAYSFVEKPYDPRRLLHILHHAAEQSRMRADNDRLRARLLALSGLDRILIGDAPPVRQVRRDVLSLAEARAPVLLLGETGTGKDLVARAIHDLGPLADRPYVAVNCALLTSERFEAEMFGTADGADGHILRADGGTLFLDEVCACPPEVQSRFLRVLEEGCLQRLGETTSRRFGIRLISATNEDMTAAIAEGRFREDLLYRLNTFTLELPPLRARREDLSVLVTHFMDNLAAVYEVARPPLSPDDLSALMSHDWPGNVRELRSVAERRLLAARRGGGSMAEAIAPGQAHDDAPETLRAAIAAFERELIGQAITAQKGRMDAVAEALGIGRRTLNEKIVKLGLDKDGLL
ncbi:sigma-54 dependent transcriptional regulator [Rhodobacteraceae bacterium N5(2021)]|uniref:Sigma-54 dependent transcriptional regulator n=1 Tax=Gymnodinialimonas phycosphaerae TaxID=2841589 RepID=A0A975YE66_9RHOB|nr:sigma-54 dependent transcriptional regulator [Gymnodinialimonas phycosphaerae]MBY4893317.1 sigma-54 dependent transcriptional regulator [Gymnodinialimonas phycosphaerae]